MSFKEPRGSLSHLRKPVNGPYLEKIPETMSSTIDKMIRSCIKSTIGLPANTSTSMFYAPLKYRGLAVFNCCWEKYLQHLSKFVKKSHEVEVKMQ